MSIAGIIAADMRAIPKETRKAVRPKLRTAAGAIARGAKTRSSWSSRIPGTVRVRTSFRLNREGVDIIAGGPKAPHARPYEGASGQGSFRHPVHGTDNWVDQETRPYLFVSGKAELGNTDQAVVSVLDEVSRSLGFR